MPLPPIQTDTFNRFLRTSTHFKGTNILSEFRGYGVQLYDSKEVPLSPIWTEGINPLDIKVHWKGFETQQNSPYTFVINGPDTIRSTNAAWYSSTHCLTICAIHHPVDSSLLSTGMRIPCTFSVTGPVGHSTTGPIESLHSFSVVDDSRRITTFTGFIDVSDMAPLVYRQYAREFDFLHISITKGMQMSLSVNTGHTILGNRSYIIIARDGCPKTHCGDPHAYDLKGYVYHKPPMQMTYDEHADPVAHKRTTLYFDLFRLPPGIYTVSVFDPDIPPAALGQNAVATIQFHSRQHTDIGDFQNHTEQNTSKFSVNISPKSATEFDINVYIPPSITGGKDRMIQIKQDNIELGWFVPTNGHVTMNTLTNMLQPGYYDVELVHMHTKEVIDSMTIFVGVYMGTQPHRSVVCKHTSWVYMAVPHVFHITVFSGGGQDVLLEVVVPRQSYLTGQLYADAFNTALLGSDDHVVKKMVMGFDSNTSKFTISLNGIPNDGPTMEGFLITPPSVEYGGSIRHYPMRQLWVNYVPGTDSMSASTQLLSRPCPTPEACGLT